MKDIRRLAKLVTKLIFTALLTLLISFVLGEIILRNFTTYGVSHYVKLGEDCNRLKDKELPYMSTYLEKDIQELLNSGQEDTASNKYRIIVLGDSIAQGGELDNEGESFPCILETILQKEYPAMDIEVRILAQGGYSTESEVRLYERIKDAVVPDLVILAYCHNDAAEVFPKVRKIGKDNLLVYYKSGIVYLDKIPFNRFLTERFLLARLGNEALIDLFSKRDLQISKDVCALNHKKIYRAFKKLYSLTKTTNTPVIVIVFPYIEEIRPMDRTLMAGFIKQWCREFNFFHISLYETYRQYDCRALLINTSDTCHPNELGHKIAAEAIADKITSAFLPRPQD